MQTILNQNIFIIKWAFNQNTKRLKINRTCLLLSLGLARLVVSLGLVLSVAVMLMRERERDQNAEWEAAVCSSSTKAYTSHNPHLSFITFMKTPPLQASHHPTPHSAAEQISISSAFDLHLNKSHWKVSLIVQTYITHKVLSNSIRLLEVSAPCLFWSSLPWFLYRKKQL